MKKFYMLMLFSCCLQYISAQADQNLSNLKTPTAVNIALLPKTDNSINIGSAAKSWKNIYFDSIIYFHGIRFIACPRGKAIIHSTDNSTVANTNYTAAGDENTNTAIGANALYSNAKGAGNTGSGYQALYSNDGDFNTANGYNALYSNKGGLSNAATGSLALYSNVSGNYNTANGDEALYHNIKGSNNTATGERALNFNNSGNKNTADGSEALFSNVNGSTNTANGYQALYNNNGGNSNIAVGWESLYNNVNGSSNIAIGVHALLQNKSLSQIVAVGDSALWWLNSGSGHCTALGSKAGWQNTSGSNNTYVGYHAGNTVTTGSSNTLIGYGADVKTAALSNATAIGNLSVVDAPNRVRIGNTSVSSIGGQVAWSVFSDERVKTNIKENVPGLKFINLLKPITYNYDIDKEQNILGIKNTDKWESKYDITRMQFTGFSAQQVEKAAKQIGYDFSGVDAPKNDEGLYALRYSDFVVPLVKAVQELSKMNDDKNAKIDDLQNQINELKAMIVSNQSTVNGQSSTVLSSASLEQNIPNPFTNTTTIAYSLPQKFSSAKIIVTDKNGNRLKQINVSESGKGTVHLDAATLASGAYNYTLYVDGRLIASKQMITEK